MSKNARLGVLGYFLNENLWKYICEKASVVDSKCWTSPRHNKS